MANNIVQHRRGTTEEWKNLDLVPSEGELVIEECADGTCKCKIGNGISKFSELAYLSDPLNARAIDLLTEQHQEDIISIVDKLTTLKNDLKTDLKCLETNTETRINALFVDELRLNVNTLVSNVEQLENIVEEAKIASTDKFTKLEEDLTELHSIVLELPVDSAINESLDRTSKEILEAVDERIQEEKTNYETIVNNAHAKLEKNLVEFYNDLTELRSTFSVQLIELQDNLTVLMDTKLNNSIPALDARLDALEVDLTEQELRLLSKIQDTYSKIAKNYSTRISDIQKSLEQLEKDTKDAISGVYEGLEDLAHSVSKHFSATKESISGVQRLSEDALAQLTQLRTDNELWHLAINGSINTIEKHLAALDSDCDKMVRDIIDIQAELKHMPTNSDLNSVLEKLESHLANHESIGLLLDITETDINDWRRASKAFLERFKNLLYVSDNAELCAGVDLVDSVVLDCGTA